MSTSPQRQSARRRLTRNAGEKSDDARVSNDKNLPNDAGNVPPGVNGNLSQGKDSSQGNKIVQEKDDIRKTTLDSQVNDRLVNKMNGSNQVVRKGGSALSRAKSPVRPGKPSKASSISKAIRIFFKWTVLLIIIGVIGWGFWNGVMNRNPKYGLYHNDVAAEGRFAELEQSLKKTTKLLQTQLDVVDIKYGNELERLREKLEEKLEESIQEQAKVYTELLNLKEQTDNIEESLLRFSDSGILTREKVLSIVNTVMENRVDEGDGNILSLDDVRAVSRRLVEAEIERHAADGIGRVDYALGSGGGRVAQHSEGYFPGNDKRWAFLPVNLLRKAVGGLHPYAARVLKPSFGEPGHCLPLKGSSVFVVIALRTSVLVEAVTLEHVAKSNAYDRSSAPKHFRIFGWLGRIDGMSGETLQILPLGEFTYDLTKSNAQTFNLPIETRGKLVNMIKLDVQSNHGSLSHTCIYRLRVHGQEPEVPRLAEVVS